MPPSIVHLPNGQTLTVTPVFGGIQFKVNELNTHHNAFPAGWTIVIHSEDYDEDHHAPGSGPPLDTDTTVKGEAPVRKHHVHRFRRPTLRNDHLFVSSISNPSSNDFKPANSPTRQIAMMLWATLWWYYHQPAPSPYLTTTASEKTPEEGRPKGEWIVNINREGIFKGKHLLPKLERMGLIASEDSTVGVDPADGVTNAGEGWSRMFVSQRSFWQLDARIYLFTLTPAQANSPFPSVSPAVSRPGSPSRNSTNLSATRIDNDGSATAIPHLNRANTPPGPFTSGSHLPTFYPPAPAQYTFTNGTRHPIRPKPPRQGETFYTRWVPSLGQYISFRVASLSKQAVTYRGPTSSNVQPDAMQAPGTRESLRSGHTSHSEPALPTISGLSMSDAAIDDCETLRMSDTELLHRWMNDPRVSYSWGEQGPLSHQEAFLKHGLTSKHSFPVIGCFDGKPFGFFEIYWVKEDRLSGVVGGEVDDWDRGLHVLVGEQEFRGHHRVKVWLSALVHYCWLADLRTRAVMMEPRVDNEKYVFFPSLFWSFQRGMAHDGQSVLRPWCMLTCSRRLKRYCEDVGFYKEKEISFPHKQSNLLKVKREAWTAPAL
jgi:N5-hydroxyornithine acetyltransferase